MGKPKELTYEQIVALVRNVAAGLEGHSDTTASDSLMLLMWEIALHTGPNSHVESIVNMLTNHIFMYTASDEYEKRYIEDFRQRFIEGGAQ
jgi:hypothetical protein